jgi:hypothetical protein
MNAIGSNQTKIFHLERVSLESSRDDILAGIHLPALISQTQITPRLNKSQSPKLEQRDQKSIFCGDFGTCKVCVALGHGEGWSLSPLAGSRERKPQTRQQRCYDSPKQLKLIHCIQLLPISYCCKLAFLSTHQVRPRTMALNKLPDELVLHVVYQLASPKDLSNLALCSHHLHAIAIPILYSSFAENQKQFTWEFLCTLLKRPDLALRQVFHQHLMERLLVPT